MAAVEAQPTLDRARWDAIIRQHHHRVVVALLAIGLRPPQAHEIANDAWARLYEQHRAGALATLEFPGLAIAQARFLALDALRRAARERDRVHSLDAVRDLQAAPVEPPALSADEIAAVHATVAACAPNAQKVFHLVYTRPDLPHAEVARQLGLSTQRVRQILCEVRQRVRQSLEKLR